MTTTTIRTETAPAIDGCHARWGQPKSHRTLSAAVRAAARRAVPGSVIARVVVDRPTLAALLASGEVYETAQGEIIDRAQTTTIDCAEVSA